MVLGCARSLLADSQRFLQLWAPARPRVCLCSAPPRSLEPFSCEPGRGPQVSLQAAVSPADPPTPTSGAQRLLSLVLSVVPETADLHMQKTCSHFLKASFLSIPHTYIPGACNRPRTSATVHSTPARPVTTEGGWKVRLNRNRRCTVASSVFLRLLRSDFFKTSFPRLLTPPSLRT